MEGKAGGLLDALRRQADTLLLQQQQSRDMLSTHSRARTALEDQIKGIQASLQHATNEKLQLLKQHEQGMQWNTQSTWNPLLLFDLFLLMAGPCLLRYAAASPVCHRKLQNE